MDQVIKKQKMGIALKCLEDLPEEIILKILGQVNIRDLFRCSSVNKKFREIVHDKSLWEKMNLHSKVDVPAELFAKLLEKGCEYLSVPVISNVQGTARFQNNLKLKYLSFRVSKSADSMFSTSLINHIPNYPLRQKPPLLKSTQPFSTTTKTHSAFCHHN